MAQKDEQLLPTTLLRVEWCKHIQSPLKMSSICRKGMYSSQLSFYISIDNLMLFQRNIKISFIEYFCNWIVVTLKWWGLVYSHIINVIICISNWEPVGSFGNLQQLAISRCSFFLISVMCVNLNNTFNKGKQNWHKNAIHKK